MSSSSTVLLAHDDNATRELIAVLLRGRGYRVIEAIDGFELFDRLGLIYGDDDGPAPEVVLCDLELPGYTGLEALITLRKNDLSTPVVLLADSVEQPGTALARALGAHVLQKPVDIDVLAHTVSTALSRRAA